MAELEVHLVPFHPQRRFDEFLGDFRGFYLEEGVVGSRLGGDQDQVVDLGAGGQGLAELALFDGFV